MQEDFIDWIWRNRLFIQQELTCESGEELEILNTGIRNNDSGPDYFNARLKIDGVVWIGNVELHVKASDWLRHKHHYDPMYENVILHVVHEADAEIYRKDGSRVPELVLRNRYEPDLLKQYLDLVQGPSQWIPCERLLDNLPPVIWQSWISKVISKRLDQRSVQLKEVLVQTGMNWEEAFYRKLSAAFGFRVNNEPFAMLAASLPLRIIRRHMQQENYTEALLFGQSGMLDDVMNDAYSKMLNSHYRHLKKLHQLNSIPAYIWKFGRLRPANFPTRRIAQLAALLRKRDNLFNMLVQCDDLNEIKSLLRAEPDSYWKRHYRFHEEIIQSSAAMGPNSIENIIINVIIPFIYYYGRYHGIPSLSEKAVSWLELCMAEDNSILRKWNEIGIQAANALESQSLIYLHREYCMAKKCVNCGIGQHLLQLK